MGSRYAAHLLSYMRPLTNPQTLHNILTRHPSSVFVPASELFRDILPHLISPNRPLRLRAAYALAGFAHAAIQTYETPVHGLTISKAQNHLRELVCDFAKLQGTRSRPNATGTQLTLRDLLIKAMPESKNGACSPDVAWAFSVIGSLTVLAQGYTFTSPTLLKMVIQCLPRARNHDWKVLRSLHSFAWRCLIWAFVRTPSVLDPPASDDPSESAEQNFRRKVFSIVRQDGRPGVRTALVYALLSMEPAACHSGHSSPTRNGVSDALLVVEDLIASSSKALYTEGTALLRRLTCSGDSTSQDGTQMGDLKILPACLLDGSLLGARSHSIDHVVRRMTVFDADMVRSLTEVEIEEHWHRLLSIWELGVKCIMEEGVEIKLAVGSIMSHFMFFPLMLAYRTTSQLFGSPCYSRERSRRKPTDTFQLLLNLRKESLASSRASWIQLWPRIATLPRAFKLSIGFGKL